MKKRNPRNMAQRALAADAQAAQKNHGLWERMTGGGATVQREITKPLSDLAREIQIDHVTPDSNQPRKTMDQASIEGLAASIRENGLLQPITVTWSEGDDAYRIITGHRRLAAAKQAGLKTIAAIIRPDAFDERQRLQQQLVENIQREGIPPIEEARAIQTLMEATALSQRQVAAKLGKPATYIKELLSILRIPTKSLEKAKDLPKRALVEIARAGTPHEQKSLLSVALKAENPYQQVKKARTDRREPAPPTFRASYSVKDRDATVTVAIKKSPDQVDTKQVVEALTKLIQSLIAEETGIDGKPRKHR